MPKILTLNFLFSFILCLQIVTFCWSIFKNVKSIKSTYEYIVNMVIPIFLLIERNNATIISFYEKLYGLIIPRRIEEDRNRQQEPTNDVREDTSQKESDDKGIEGEYKKK